MLDILQVVTVLPVAVAFALALAHVAELPARSAFRETPIWWYSAFTIPALLSVGESVNLAVCWPQLFLVSSRPVEPKRFG
jgi:hypothetical protein